MSEDFFSTLNPDAAEFKPSGISERFEALSFIRGFVRKSFEGSPDEIEKYHVKIAYAMESKSMPDAPILIGQSIVQFSICKSGNAHLGFRLIKRLQNNLNNADNIVFENGIFDSIHSYSMARVNGDHLKKMAEKKSLSVVESGDSATTEDFPVLVVELLHLIVMFITDFYKTNDGQLAAPPSQPCVDLCVLADAAFKIQSDMGPAACDSCATENSAISSEPLKRSYGVNGWCCLLDVLLTSITQSIPYFNMLLQVSDGVCPPSTWNTTPGTSDRPLQTDITVGNSDCLYSAALLSNYIDRILFRVKYMLVNEGFPSIWLRSTALDLLLSVVPPNSIMSCGQGAESEWAENLSLSGDDISIEGLTSADGPDVLNAFRSFLASSGQIENRNS